MNERLVPVSTEGLDESALLARLIAKLRGLEREGKVSHATLDRELLWLAVILSSSPVVAGLAGVSPLRQLSRLVREDASRLRTHSEVLRKVAARECSKSSRRRHGGLHVLEGGGVG